MTNSLLAPAGDPPAASGGREPAMTPQTRSVLPLPAERTGKPGGTRQTETADRQRTGDTTRARQHQILPVTPQLAMTVQPFFSFTFNQCHKSKYPQLLAWCFKCNHKRRFSLQLDTVDFSPITLAQNQDNVKRTSNVNSGLINGCKRDTALYVGSQH